MSLGELLEEPPLGQIRVTRAAQSPLAQRNGVRRRTLDAIAPSPTLELTEIALEPRQVHQVEPRPAGSRGQVYVLQGKLIAGPPERITELVPGDYASFPIDVPHIYEARQHAVRALLLTQTGG